jgi:hypothetical protein
MLQGAPVLLLDVDTQKIDRLGFYTTRWVQAASAEEAGSVQDVAQVSWFEMARRGPGRGFTFYPDGAS